MSSIVTSRHPKYNLAHDQWVFWRDTYEGGQAYVEKYLTRLSRLETNEDYASRKAASYCPAFAASAVNDIKNAIYERLPDVLRYGGPPTYKRAVKGEDGGVDYKGTSMNTFMGDEVTRELLTMSKVGVLIDQDADLGVTYADKGNKHPYLTVYRAENILNWAGSNPENGFDAVLLAETVEEVDEYGLPTECRAQYRLMRRLDYGVQVIFFDDMGKQTDEHILSLQRIPFVVLEINQSLLHHAADYQRALLIIESSDISFIRKANYPLFYEFYDGRKEMPHQLTNDAAKTPENEIKVGMAQGRRYPKDVDPPGFVNPDPDTLRVSMEKAAKLKEDIRKLVSLNLIEVKRASSESKEMDQRSLEAGLSAVATILQTGEQEIGLHWASFEGSDERPKITYPRTFKLKTDDQRIEEASKLDKLADKIPSDTFRREVRKRAAIHLLAAELPIDVLDKIKREIDSAPSTTSDPNMILSAHKAGLVDDVTASKAIGFDGDNVIEQARKDRAERIRLTLEAQGGPENASGARGAPEFDKGLRTSEQEKNERPKRGAANNTDIGNSAPS